MANQIAKALNLIQKQVRKFQVPIVTIVSENKDPYQVLISCILSLRTKDKTTAEASARLFKVANNPFAMVKLTAKRVQGLIYPVGFYRNKARVIIKLSSEIINHYNGLVPNKLEDLLKFKGVGRKTANLVLGLGYNIAAICVDTHVHRISNRLGWVKTKTPEQTEESLMRIVPKQRWIDLNTILVTFGQNICVPVSPFCSLCSVYRYCGRIGVKRYR